MSKVGKTPNFFVQGTVKLGTGFKSGDDILEALVDGNYSTSASSRDALSTSGFKTCKIAHEVQIVNVSVAELGFIDGATVKDIYAKALEFGLLLCPPEVAPQILFQKLQRRDQWARIAMEPVLTMTGIPIVFSVGDDWNQLWLGTYNAYPSTIWLGKARCIFLQRN